MSQPTPQLADDETLDEVPGTPRVRVLITAFGDADIEAAIAVVGRQVYAPTPEVVVVGEDLELDADVATVDTLDEAISSTDSSFDYLWLLHSDARPRPDALGALIAEIERNEATLAGSKLLKAGTMDELESVGGATDVFGEPYSGLDEGEIDLQQYDVVREVAFVQSASMLVRRDLAQGLRGLDPLLPPVAAGLDFSQRTRLAGGKVISVPSSEVYHQARCGQRGAGWREQAGRLRAMLIAYRPLTLLWVVPYDLLVSALDSVASLFLLRWRPLVRHLLSWVWNLLHLYSTLRQRRRLRSIRSEGDEELFRFQAKGSIRLRAIGEEVSGRVLSVFDEDQALARRSRRLWGSPGIWGAVVAAVIAFVSARAIVFTGMANSGFSFPFEPATVALERWFGGWNEAGLGSSSPVHPSVGLTGLLSLIWFGAADAARTLSTIAVSLVGIIGLGRLGGRLGLRGPGRYLAGLVLIAGPGTAVLVGRGSWLALAAAAFLPWAVRAVFVHPHEFGRSRLTYVGWALLTALVVAALSPLLVLVPLLVVLVWRLLGGDRGGVLLGLVSMVGGVAGAAFLTADPRWVFDGSRVVYAPVDQLWPVLIVVGAAPLLLAEGRIRMVGLTGGVIALTALAAARGLALGPGLQEAVLITASLGAALVVAAALDSFSRQVVRLVAAAGAVAVLMVSLGTVGNGRLGLPHDDLNERLGFSTTLADDHGPGRILYASVDRDSIPGEARSGPGFWYRLLDGQGTTQDEVWLPERQEGDELLETVLAEIGSGAELRPGAALAPFAIDWVVLEGPSFVLDEALRAQLDLVPTPLDPDSRVYENRESAPLAGSGDVAWIRSGTGFSGGRTGGEVTLAINHADGWDRNGTRADWAVSVDGSTGRAWYSPQSIAYVPPAATLTLLVAAIGMIVWGRRRP